MFLDSEAMVSITEASHNFSKIASIVDQKGEVVIMKNNKPKYLLIDFSAANRYMVMDNDKVMRLSEELMKQNKEVYEALAK